MKLNQKEVYSILRYKNNIHEMYADVKVKSKKGKVFAIYKTENNVGTPSFKISKRGSQTVLKSSSTKQGVINFLKSN